MAAARRQPLGCGGNASKTIVSNEARSLFFQYRDKDLSFTDCTSIVVMRELKLTTVIATDHHFHQVGFDVLPAVRLQKARKPRRS